MDDNPVIVEWQLESTRLDVDHFGWPEYREFLNRLTAVLEVLPSGPKPQFVLPCQVSAGSVRVATRMLPIHLIAVEALRKGPTAAWNSKQRRRAEALYTWTRARGARLSVTAGEDERRAVEMPDAPISVARESTTLLGQVHRAGGTRGTVDVRFPDHAIVVCTAGRALAEELGAHLYKHVAVSGRASWDGLGRLIEFEIESFVPALRMMPSEALKELHVAVGSALDHLDADAILAERNE